MKKINILSLLLLVEYLYIIIFLSFILIRSLFNYKVITNIVQEYYYASLSISERELITFIYKIAIVTLIIIIINMMLALITIKQNYFRNEFLKFIKVILKFKISLFLFYLSSLIILILFISPWRMLSDWPIIVPIMQATITFLTFSISSIYSITIIYKLYRSKILNKKQFIKKVIFQLLFFFDIFSYINLCKDIRYTTFKEEYY